MTSMVEQGCGFPLFRDRFLLAEPAAQAPTPPRGKPGSLKVLDLRTLPRDDGPPTELRARKDKLAFFDRQCTRVGEGLFVSGETVAKSREVLRASGITHVVNCVGFLYPAYFENELAYKVLFLQDTPGEDILCVLYDVFDFIEEAAGGKVLVHCSQGVSRSTALAIAYLMWKTGGSYDDVFTQVKAQRGVANPNIGFICQLLQWHKRRHSPVERCRMYRMAPQSTSVPHYLVPKPVSSPQLASLDPRGAFVVQSESTVYVWEGARCTEDFAAAATRFAQQLVKYEGAEGPVVGISQGREPGSFWECLAAGAAGTSEASSSSSSGAGSPRENSGYDKDFELYRRVAGGSNGGGAAGGAESDSARSGRKTPRDEVQAHSPNERLRKQARSGAEAKPVSGAALAHRAVEDVSTRELERGVSIDSASKELVEREQRVKAQAMPLPSRLQRSSSEEVSVPSLLLAGLDQEDSEEEAGAGSSRSRRSSGSGVTGEVQPAASTPTVRPAVPSLKLKLPQA